jgi:hypothetical protein
MKPTWQLEKFANDCLLAGINMSDLKWEDVKGLDRLDIITELEDLAKNAEETASAKVYGPSESYSWAGYAESIRAAIRKLKESDE